MIFILQTRRAQVVERTKSQLNSNHISLQDLNLDIWLRHFFVIVNPHQICFIMYLLSCTCFMYLSVLCHKFLKWQGEKTEEEFNVVSTRWAKQLFLSSVCGVVSRCIIQESAFSSTASGIERLPPDRPAHSATGPPRGVSTAQTTGPGRAGPMCPRHPGKSAQAPHQIQNGSLVWVKGNEDSS